MTTKPTCNRCGSGMEATWKHCPVCGQSVDGVLENPFTPSSSELSQEDKEDRSVVYQQANQDLQNTGVGIQILALVVALGMGFILFNSRLTSLGSLDKVTSWIVVGGIVCVALTIVGVVIKNLGKSRGEASVLAIFLESLTSLIQVISLIGFFILLWILAGIIYFLETCCRNNP